MMRRVDDYELIDAGDHRRLERFGAHVVDRPAPGAASPLSDTPRWHEADLRFDRGAGWSGSGIVQAQTEWTISIRDLRLELRATDAGQVGLFPEHAAMLPWIRDRVRERLARDAHPRVLHLFASTGLATLAAASAGAAVVHVDAARAAVEWARRNAASNGLAERPIRWLVDDAPAFVSREVRRGRRYDGLLLDPPTYGHGAGGRAWRILRDLPDLVRDLERVRAPDGFTLLTTHTASLRPDDLGDLLGPRAETGPLRLVAASGAVLDLGAFARLG
jgi:23S rRNA (cytosine1962-C5)-methyltransferase